MTNATTWDIPAKLRRWSVLAAALAAAGWLSTLSPTVATADSGTTVFHVAPVSAPVSAGEGVRRVGPPVPGFPGLGGGKVAPQQPTAVVNGVDCRKRKCIALTFDDGPVGDTRRLLETLAAHKAKATFFLVGRNVVEDPALVVREHAEGHQLANHSYSHVDLGRSSTSRVRSEIGRTQEAVRKVSGVTPELFRPPYGSTNGAVAAVARRHKLPQILWSLDTSDWRDRNAALVERRVVKGARPGAIVLMHDIHRTTVSAVPGILRKLTAKGYVFVTISELYKGRTLVPGKKYTKR